MSQSKFGGISSDALNSLLSKIQARKKEEIRVYEEEKAARLKVNTSLPPNAVRKEHSQQHSQLPENVGIDRYGNLITYNAEQIKFISLASKGESCILIGSAGTGKTTTMNGAIASLINSGLIPVMVSNDHKYISHIGGTHGIIATSYTRRAVSNLRKAMPPELVSNCVTIHKLLEFQPEYFEIVDPITGETRRSMSFSPTRNSTNPLPPDIHTIIIDEASMVSCELFALLLDALPHKVQFIFLGDIQQLPPVFGSAILGFKMLELPTVELVQVYRTAGTIINWATKIKSGESFMVPANISESCERSKITFHPWKKKLHSDVACKTFCFFLKNALDNGAYNPEEDCILIPFNKAFGTLEVNSYIANHLAKSAGRPVWEIISGFNKLYFSVGDKVLYDKEDAHIVDIKPNPNYLGKKPQQESVFLDYYGMCSQVAPEKAITSFEDAAEDDIDFMLDQLGGVASDDDSERVRAASHKVTVVMDDTGQEIDVDTASGLNTLILSYALTIHKSQGSEWQKVFLVLHQSHSTMCQRELLYTAVTRAAKELYVICENDTFDKGVKSQRIKGDTLQAKAEYFKGLVDKKLY